MYTWNVASMLLMYSVLSESFSVHNRFATGRREPNVVDVVITVDNVA